MKNEQDGSLLIEQRVKTFGELDGLVNNAGWFPQATLQATTSELWDEVLQVNLRGSFYCCKYAVPVMRAHTAAEAL